MTREPEALNRLVHGFAEAPGIGVAILTANGRVLYHNREAARLHFRDADLDAVGKTLDELYPREWVSERLRLYRRALETGRAILVRSMHNGVRLETVIRPGGEVPEGGASVMVILRPGCTPDEAVPRGMEVVDFEIVSLGPLAVLTPREVEVLALIGRGRSAREIGSVLGCSPRTVERHRDAIGKKLRKSDRVDLALIAHGAGLEVRDAHRQRVEPLVGPGRGAGSVIEGKPPVERSRRVGGTD